jgi:Zinc-binding dehydrogenase
MFPSRKSIKGPNRPLSCWSIGYLSPHFGGHNSPAVLAVSQCLIQLAKAEGAKCIIATASSDEKTKLCEELGATKGINYKKHDWGEEVKKIAPDGVDFIVDFILGSPRKPRSL